MSYTRLKKRHLIRHHIRRHIEKIKASEYARILILRTAGNFLLLSSLFMIGRTFYRPLREEIRYFLDTKTEKKYVVADTMRIAEPEPANRGLLAKAFNIKSVEVLTPQDPNFSIVIPKIGANSKVIGNVDVTNEKEYLDVLQKGVAHAAGTAFPGEGGHVFLFAHSTDYFWNVGTYNAIFYLLYKLEKNDEVDVFYKGQRHVYKVIGTEVVDPSQVQYLTRKTNREFLTLQTCWPLGTTLRRLLVFAVRQAE
ncbi:MAG: sortase [Patescibacteria group bacterium]